MQIVNKLNVRLYVRKLYILQGLALSNIRQGVEDRSSVSYNNGVFAERIKMHRVYD